MLQMNWCQFITQGGTIQFHRIGWSKSLMRAGKKHWKAIPVKGFNPHQTPESLMSHDEHDEDSHQSKDP